MARDIHLKGVSLVITSFLLAISASVIFTYILIQTTLSIVNNLQFFGNVAIYSHKHEIAQLILNKSTDGVHLFNVGSSDIILDKVVVKPSEESIEVVEVDTICSSNVVPVKKSIRCSTGYEYIAVVTIDGVVIYPQTPIPKAYILQTNSTYLIPITFSIKNPQDLQQEFGVPLEFVAKPYTKDRAQIGFRGMSSSQHVLLLPPGQESEFNNAEVTTESSGLAFGGVLIAYDPSWVVEKMNNPNANISPRFTIMITGTDFPSRVAGPEEMRINIGRRQYTLSGNGYRILINNFTGIVRITRGNVVIACSSTSQGGCPSNVLPAIGAWYYGSTDSEINLRLHLNGVGGYVAKFMRIASSNSPTGETSYYPYLFVGDVDSNGLNEIIFLTEDANYNSSSGTNDYYNNDDLSDWSTRPLILKLLQVGRELGFGDGSIDGSIYAGVALYVNLFFHDNSHPDEDQLRDNDRTDWVLRILLIDSSGNEYIVREYRYQEICNYHKTRITDFGRDNYFAKLSQSIYVNFPASGKYWIAIAFQDSYRSGRTNDVDFTVGVEFVGIIPFLR